MELLTKTETLELFEALHAEIKELRSQLKQLEPNGKVYYTRKEAAQYLSLSLKTLDMHASTGEIKRAKFGEGKRSRVLYRRQDLDDFVARHLEIDNVAARKIARAG